VVIRHQNHCVVVIRHQNHCAVKAVCQAPGRPGKKESQFAALTAYRVPKERSVIKQVWISSQLLT